MINNPEQNPKPRMMACRGAAFDVTRAISRSRLSISIRAKCILIVKRVLFLVGYPDGSSRCLRQAFLTCLSSRVSIHN